MAKNKRFILLIKNKGLKKTVLADKLGVTPTTIRYWIIGRNSPSMAKLFEMAKVFDRTVEELYYMFKQ